MGRVCTVIARIAGTGAAAGGERKAAMPLSKLHAGAAWRAAPSMALAAGTIRASAAVLQAFRVIAMPRKDEYGTNAEAARASTRGRHLIARPVLWVIIAIVLIGLLTLSYW